ncbi:MAG: hypothetical protein H0T46_34040 [Deltaproteobacteria bacterium]|nr:hypothetical protein [Deltaproteobacteria bacterium]
MSRVIIAVGATLLTGCFIEQLPSANDDGSGQTGKTPQIRSLALSPGTSCAVLVSGEVRCWGSVFTALGGTGGHQTLRPVVIQPLAGAESLAITNDHGCVLKAGNVHCFGRNDQGQVGNGQRDPSMEYPLQPTIGGTGVAQLSLGQSNSGARTNAGTVLLWGAAFVGLGPVMPTEVAGLTGVTDLSLGGDHNCVAHQDGTASCWGWNRGTGQLGRGTVDPNGLVEDPAPVIGVTTATQVIAGQNNCVRHTDGTVSCWGGPNSYFNPAQPTPTLTPGLSDVKVLIGGDGHTCALHNTGTVSCWGGNESGELGIGQGAPSSMVPVAVPGLSNIVELAAGGSSTCARRGDGEVLCWGYNVPGDGSMTGSPVPVQVRWLTSES